MANKQIVIGGKSFERRELVDDEGHLMGVLEYDPGDIGILGRYPELEKRLNAPELSARLDKIDELREASAQANAAEIALLLAVVEEEIMSCFDFFFNIDSRNTCFSVKSPLWVHKIEVAPGRYDTAYWFQRIFYAIRAIMDELNDAEVSKKLERVDAATAEITG